jgi:thioredoxin-like negative regulator of GroEL
MSDPSQCEFCGNTIHVGHRRDCITMPGGTVRRPGDTTAQAVSGDRTSALRASAPEGIDADSALNHPGIAFDLSLVWEAQTEAALTELRMHGVNGATRSQLVPVVRAVMQAWPGRHLLAAWVAKAAQSGAAAASPPEGIDDRRAIAALWEIIAWFPDCAQLLDGWHSDGTAWTEWDESVRKRLAALWSKALAVLPTQAGVEAQPTPEGANAEPWRVIDTPCRPARYKVVADGCRDDNATTNYFEWLSDAIDEVNRRNAQARAVTITPAPTDREALARIIVLANSPGMRAEDVAPSPELYREADAILAAGFKRTPEGATMGEALGSDEYNRRAEKYGEEVAAIMQARDAAIARAARAETERDAAKMALADMLGDRTSAEADRAAAEARAEAAESRLSDYNDIAKAAEDRAEAAEKAAQHWERCSHTHNQDAHRELAENLDLRAKLAAAEAQAGRMREALRLIAHTVNADCGWPQDFVERTAVEAISPADSDNGKSGGGEGPPPGPFLSMTIPCSEVAEVAAVLGITDPTAHRDDNVCGVCGASWGTRHSETCRNVPAAKGNG